ncbi:MAG: 50S ribosomal protein L6 [Candidatus Pacebacteria bacterium]|nr:50S ribosomal protein L6 [Candidatus Paceibacterota bacterium]
MSRIGKKELIIPSGTEVSIVDGVVIVKGKGGTLTRIVNSNISIIVDGEKVIVTPANKTSLANALWGTFSSHVSNMITGIDTPFTKELVVEGVGFKVALNGKTLNLKVGYSHDVNFEVPEDVTVEVEKNNIKLSSIDKEALGQFAAEIRASKKPEPYKGKGIRYSDEVVRRKQGKRAAT